MLDLSGFERIETSNPIWNYLRGISGFPLTAEYPKKIIFSGKRESFSNLNEISRDILRRFEVESICFEFFDQGAIYTNQVSCMLPDRPINVIFKNCKFGDIRTIAENQAKILFYDSEIKFHPGSGIHDGKNILFYRCKISLDIANTGVPVSFENCEFSKMRFHGGEIYDGFSIKNSTINCCPIIGKTQFPQDILLSEGNKYICHTKESEGVYRELKKRFSEHHNSSEEAFFFSHELETKYLTSTPKVNVMYWFALIYWYINRLGRSLMWPLVWIFVLSVVLSVVDVLVYHQYSFFRFNLVKETYPVVAIYVSNLFLPLLYLALEKPSYAKASIFWEFWKALEVIGMSLLYFFFILGIRKRFKIG